MGTTIMTDTHKPTAMDDFLDILCVSPNTPREVAALIKHTIDPAKHGPARPRETKGAGGVRTAAGTWGRRHS